MQNVPEGTTQADLVSRLKAGGHDVSALEAPPSAAQRFGQGADIAGQVANIASWASPHTLPVKLFGKGMEAAGDLVNRGAYSFGAHVTDVAGPEVGALANMGAQAAPMLLGGGAGRAASTVSEGLAKDLMQKALKPSEKALAKGKGDQAVQTMLDEGLNVSSGGVAKLKQMVGDLNTEVSQKLAPSEGRVSTQAVSDRLVEMLRKAESQSLPEQEIQAIKAAREEFLRSHPENISVQRAHELKQNTYESVGNRPYLAQQQADVAAKTKAEMALARGLREEVAGAAPEVQVPLAKEAELMNAMKMAQKRVLLEGNKDIGGIGWLAHNIKDFAAFLALRNPYSKSLAARLLNSGLEPTGAAVGGVYGAQSGLPPTREGYTP